MENKNLVNPVNPVKKLKGKSILNPLPMKERMNAREGVGGESICSRIHIFHQISLVRLGAGEHP
jgi:hypothetical protein